jgi:hypothetical protein
MRLASEKFKHLDSISPILPSGSVPSFQKMETLEEINILNKPYIMRSALKNEASNMLLQSGKSLSIVGVDSLQKLHAAWDLVRAQEDLDEVILQEEVLWNTHVTLIYETDFFFAELKNREGSQQLLYWTPLGSSIVSETSILKKFLEPLKSYLEKEPFWLMELGIKDNQVFIFQLHTADPSLLAKIFTSDIVAQIVASRLNLTKANGLWNLLKTEWKARKFRQSMNCGTVNPSKIFNNWEYLFYYFKIFCMLKKLDPTAQSFASFLASSGKSSWLSGIVKKHLELANYYRASKDFDPMKVGIAGQGPIFVGKGTYLGIVGIDIHVCEEISLDLIYREERPKVIITKEVGILSHPVLASLENGVNLVLGLSELPEAGERIFLDFDTHFFTVQ